LLDEYYDDRIGNDTRNRRSESFRAKVAIQFFIETLLIGQMGLVGIILVLESPLPWISLL
jgi:hypothetical protein